MPTIFSSRWGRHSCLPCLPTFQMLGWQYNCHPNDRNVRPTEHSVGPQLLKFPVFTSWSPLPSGEGQGEGGSRSARNTLLCPCVSRTRPKLKTVQRSCDASFSLGRCGSRQVEAGLAFTARGHVASRFAPSGGMLHRQDRQGVAWRAGLVVTYSFGSPKGLNTTAQGCRVAATLG